MIAAMIPVAGRSGPRARLVAGHLPDFGRDPLGFLQRCVRDHGDVVPLRFFHRRVCLANDPALIEFVLATGARKFRKTLGYRTPFMRRLFGQGLLTSEGGHWTLQRRLAQPAFHRDRLARYAGHAVDFSRDLLREWNAGDVREIHGEVLQLTTRVVTKSLFNSEVPPEIDRLSESSAVVMKRFSGQWNGWRLLLNLLPTGDYRRFRQVMRQLDEFIYSLIRDRRASGEDKGDLLSMLLAARDEDGSAMTDSQLRDELTTMMVAGLDTTALALSWAIFLLARHPAAQEDMGRELDREAPDGTPGWEALPRLRFTECVIRETMRLYPPAWIIGREALEDCEFAGVRIARGTSVIMSQWLVHRDARWFADPEQFRPGRWMEEGVRTLPRFAYFPFGGGPRICIGNHFAMMEATLALATIAARFAFRPVAGRDSRPWPSITLQPRGGIWVRLEDRSRAEEVAGSASSLPARVNF